MGRWMCGIVVLMAFGIVIVFSPACAWAQDADNPYTIYGDGGIGLYGGLGKSNPNYNVDAGGDLSYQKLFGEIEAGADTANANGADNGYTIRTHGLAFYRGKGSWSYGGGLHYSEFQSSSYKQHELWPTVALLYDKRWVRANFQYLIPAGGSNYPENGPLVDLRLRLTHGFYYRARVGLLFYHDNLESPQGNRTAGEAFFDILYVFHDRK